MAMQYTFQHSAGTIYILRKVVVNNKEYYTWVNLFSHVNFCNATCEQFKSIREALEFIKKEYSRDCLTHTSFNEMMAHWLVKDKSWFTR